MCLARGLRKARDHTYDGMLSSLALLVDLLYCVQPSLVDYPYPTWDILAKATSNTPLVQPQPRFWLALRTLARDYKL